LTVFGRAWRAVSSIAPTTKLAMWVAVAALCWLLPLPTPVGSWLSGGVLAAVAVLAVSDLVRAPSRDALRVLRETPAQLGSGDDAEVRYAVHSAWPSDVSVELADRFPAALGGGTVTQRLLRVPALATTEVAAPIRGIVRGPATLLPAALRVHGRLGLMDVIRDVAEPHQVDVVPSLSQVKQFRLLAVQRRLRDAGVRQIRRRGGGLTFDALREYVAGDDPRHIDWKATARRGPVQVRQYTVEQGQTVIIALDAGRLMTQIAGDRSRFEYAINSALILADVAMQGRDKVGLLVFDDEVRGWVPPSHGTATMRAMRSVLAAQEARLVEPDYALAFKSLAQRQRSRAMVICLSDVVDARASRAVVTQTRHAALRHITIFLALRNDTLVSAAQPVSAASESTVWRSAAAEALLDARSDALQRMRRSGVQVLDVPPQAMSAALVNRYLAIKARGEL
jgi:uncharacterized protein (DUF58 family)